MYIVSPFNSKWFCTSTPFINTVAYAGVCKRSVRIKYRRHPDDVIALPLARLSNRVDERNPLLINASCLAVDIPRYRRLLNERIINALVVNRRRLRSTVCLVVPHDEFPSHRGDPSGKADLGQP